MRLLLTGLLLIVGTTLVFAGALPLTEKEISLMLRSGYSNEAVIHELSTRHFADTFDAATEKQLGQAGANAALLDALRSGSFQASAAEISAAQEKINAQAEQTAEARERSAELQSRAKATKADARPKPGFVGEPVNEVYKLLKGDLVYRHLDTIVHFDDEELEKKKYYLFFFSANWSQAGRRFTPELIEYYNRVVSQHPELEVIFFSADRSQFGMETYVNQSNMPWPAVAYDKVGAKASRMETKSIKEIPCLILIDAAGRILSTSSGSDGEAGPHKVLADLDKVLAGGSPSRVARSR